MKIGKLLRNDKFYYFLVILSLIYSFSVTKLYKFESKYTSDNNIFTGIIIEKEFDGNKLSFTIKAKENIVCTYYIETLDEKKYLEKNFKLGNRVKIEGELKKPKNNTVPNGFNYKNYLYNNKIFWTLSVQDIVEIKETNNIIYKVKNSIIERIDNFNYSSKYLYAFILGDTSKIDDEVLSSYRTNGISHLFAVSGMHVSLITGIILFILKKLRIKDTISTVICIILLLFYMFLTNFLPSVLRAALLFILLTINRIAKLNFKSINIILFILSLNLFLNPFYLYNISFQYSYSICIGLILFKNVLKNYKNYFSKTLIVSLIAFLIGLPITMYNFYQVNLLSTFLNLVFVPLISIIIFPFSLITFFIPPLEFIDNILITFLEKLSLFATKFKMFNLILAKPPIFIMILYCILIIFVLYKIYKRKYIYIGLTIIVLLFHNNYLYFNKKAYMIMIDVGQGDSTLIVLPNNKGNILIDTGGLMNFNNEKWEKRSKLYSIAIDTTISMLKSLGIKDIDYLILTHGDYDHMGESINLINNFNVDNIIINDGEVNNNEKVLYNYFDHKKIKKYGSDDILKIDKYKFQFLNPITDFNDENKNSLVIYTNILNNRILFMGDASKETENLILNKYNLDKIDILKVGHHGSNTSTKEEFIDIIEPKYSLISVGANNRFGHPKEEVLKTLKNSTIYRTDLNGSVIFNLDNNNTTVKIFPP